MLVKTIEPIIESCASLASCDNVIGTKVEYRLFGILLYKKLFFTPGKYGIKNWNHYQVVI